MAWACLTVGVFLLVVGISGGRTTRTIEPVSGVPHRPLAEQSIRETLESEEPRVVLVEHGASHKGYAYTLFYDRISRAYIFHYRQAMVVLPKRKRLKEPDLLVPPEM